MDGSNAQPKVVRFPAERAVPPSADLDVLFLSAFLQLDTLYTSLRKHPREGVSDDAADMVADLMTGVLDAWEAKKQAETD